jgi:hypothetical protein
MNNVVLQLLMSYQETLISLLLSLTGFLGL